MPRSRRLFISRAIGLYHITSQVTGGAERLRSRLGSTSRFIQELKQRFTLQEEI